MKKDAKNSLDIKKLKQKLVDIFSKTEHYFGISIFVIVIVINIFLVLQISKYSSLEPTEDDILSKSSEFKKLKIDEDSIKKMQDLEGQNIEVKTLFDEKRKELFNE